MRLTVVVAVIAIAVFGIPLAIGVAQYLLSDQYAQLERTAGDVAIAVSGDLNPAPAPPPGSDPDLQVAVYDAGGDRVSGAGPDRSNQLVAGALAGIGGTGTDAGRLGAAVPVSDGDVIAGAVLVTIGRSAVVLRIGLIWSLMLMLAGAACCWPGCSLIGRPAGWFDRCRRCRWSPNDSAVAISASVPRRSASPRSIRSTNR